MNSRTTARAGRGSDIALAAAILAVLLLGWLTATGSNHGASHSGQPAAPARLSGRTRTGRDATGNFYVAPRQRDGNRPPSMKGTPR